METQSSTLLEAFFQVDTLKGYRYLETAGQILNRFADDFKDVSIRDDGFALARPVDDAAHLREMRVSTTQIWLHYGYGTTWAGLRQDIPTLVQWIASAMAVEGYKRQGIRTYLLHTMPDPSAVRNRLVRQIYNPAVVQWEILGEPLATETIAHIRVEGLQAKIRLLPGPHIEAVDAAITLTEDQLSALLPSPLRAHNILLDADIFDHRPARGPAVAPFLGTAVRLLEDRFTRFLVRMATEDTR